MPLLCSPSLLRISRFILVGGATVVAYYAVALGCVQIAGVGEVTAALIGWVASTSLSYLGHKVFTFRAKGRHVVYATRFLAINVPFGFGLNLALTRFLADVLHLPPQIVFAAVVLILPVGTYLINGFLVFAAPRSGAKAPGLEESRAGDPQASCTKQ